MKGKIIEKDGIKFFRVKKVTYNGKVIIEDCCIIPKEIEEDYVLARVSGFCSTEVFNKIEKYLKFNNWIFESQIEDDGISS